MWYIFFGGVGGGGGRGGGESNQLLKEKKYCPTRTHFFHLRADSYLEGLSQPGKQLESFPLFIEKNPENMEVYIHLE